MGKNRDAHVGHGDDIGRRGGRFLARFLHLGEGFIVVGEDDACAQGAHDEEDAETPVDGLESVFDIDARALGFGGHHGDVLGSDNTEGGAPHAGQESLKSAQASAGEVFCKSAGLVPVPESVGVA